MKDLMIRKQERLIMLVEQQRDAAYKVAEHNPSLFNKVLLVSTGVAAGCAAMADKEEVRLMCLLGGVLTCALGGC